ncbi:hypothetical protein [Roseibium sp.]|uniref:hypothetical protein n=1 Tax=Roseibium sp. TaxID=1936156 RepID=UPI003A9851EB
MDQMSIASAYVATTQAQTGAAIQTEVMKMAAAQEASVVALLEAGAQSLEAAASAQAAPAPGLGVAVDVTA